MQFGPALTATYRMQFHKGFDFRAAARRAAYLKALGVSHVYASPIMKATPGSTHGYDMADFAVVNPELGGEAGFAELAAALRAQTIGVILDIVPNHMAVGGAGNPYWLDLLEKGPDSAYADFFDVDFAAPGLEGKISGSVPWRPLSRRRFCATEILVVKLRGETGDFALFYYSEHCFPLRDVDQATDP